MEISTDDLNHCARAFHLDIPVYPSCEVFVFLLHASSVTMAIFIDDLNPSKVVADACRLCIQVRPGYLP